MSDFLKSMGFIFFVVGIIAGIILLIKSTDYIDNIIGVSVIIQGILLGLTLNFFGAMLENSDSQTILLSDIRDNFYPDEDEENENDE